METNTPATPTITTPVQPVSTPISNIFKSAVKPAALVTQTFTCGNCEDSGKTCSVCGFDRE